MKRKTFLKKILFSYLLALFSFLSVAPSFVAFARTDQTPNQYQGSVENRTNIPHQNSAETSNTQAASSTSLDPSNQLADTNPCSRDWSPGIDLPGTGKFCGAAADAWGAATDLPGTIFGWLKGKIVDLLVLVFQGIVAVGLKILGYSLCNVPTVDLEFCNSTFLNTPDDYNAFTAVDILIGGVFNSVPYHSPTSYIADAVQNNILGIGSAKAQSGVGPDSIDVDIITDTWAKARDLALIFMVIVMLAISLMIVFRRRLPDKNVVSVLNSLPRVGLSLFLIVFSFAISGLFLDFIYLSVNIVRDYYSGGVLNGVFNVFSTKAGGELIWIPVFTLFSSNSFIDYQHIVSFLPSGAAGGAAAIAVSAGLMLTIVIPIIELLIRFSAFAVAVWLFWKLLQTFATMLLLIIFSPFFFMVGAVPGFDGVISGWFKRMAAAALAFPAVVVIMHLALSFMWFSSWWVQVSGAFSDSGGIKAPPPIGSNILNIPYLIGIGMLFFATKIPNALQDLFGVKDGVRGGLAAGALIMAPVSATTSIFSRDRGSAGKAINETYLPVTKNLGNMKLGPIPIGLPFKGANKILGVVDRFTGGKLKTDETTSAPAAPTQNVNVTATEGSGLKVHPFPGTPEEGDTGGAYTPRPGGGSGHGGGGASGGGETGASGGATSKAESSTSTEGIKELDKEAGEAAKKLRDIPNSPGRPIKPKDSGE